MNKKVYVDLSQQDVQDIINAYEKDIEKFNKQKDILNKIKEYITTIETDYAIGCWNKDEEFVDVKKDILKLLEEIE